MTRYLTDTRPEAEAVLIDLLRQAPPWRKIRMMEQLNQQMRVLWNLSNRFALPAWKTQFWSC
jgi:hypothetical protein